MEESLADVPVIVVGIMLGVDIVFRAFDKISKLKGGKKSIPQELIKQCDDTYWRVIDMYRHVKDCERMLEKIKEKIPEGFDKIAELMQEMLLELKRISKEMKEISPSED